MTWISNHHVPWMVWMGSAEKTLSLKWKTFNQIKCNDVRMLKFYCAAQRFYQKHAFTLPLSKSGATLCACTPRGPLGGYPFNNHTLFELDQITTCQSDENLPNVNSEFVQLLDATSTFESLEWIQFNKYGYHHAQFDFLLCCLCFFNSKSLTFQRLYSFQYILKFKFLSHIAFWPFWSLQRLTYFMTIIIKLKQQQQQKQKKKKKILHPVAGATDKRICFWQNRTWWWSNCQTLPNVWTPLCRIQTLACLHTVQRVDRPFL